MSDTKPGIPIPNAKSLYVLYYRQGANPSYMQKWFEFSGNLTEAINRGRKHCEIMNMRFLSVRPFLSDLETEEKSLSAT
jgi:hypothetical protein